MQGMDQHHYQSIQRSYILDFLMNHLALYILDYMEYSEAKRLMVEPTIQVL